MAYVKSTDHRMPSMTARERKRRRHSDGESNSEKHYDGLPFHGSILNFNGARCQHKVTIFNQCGNERKRSTWIWPVNRPKKRENEKKRKKRLQNLMSKAQSWKQSQLIREYVTAVRAKVIEKNIEITPGGEIDQWITWANQQADRLDPLVETPPPGF